MPVKDKNTVLEFEYDIDPKGAMQAVTKLEKMMDKKLKLIEKTEKDLNKEMKTYEHRIKNMNTALGPGLKKQAQLYTSISESVEGVKDSAIELEKILKKGSIADLYAAIYKKEGVLEEARKAQKGKTGAAAIEGKETIRGHEAELKKLGETLTSKLDVAKDIKNARSEFESSGELLTRPLKTLMSKDLPGAIGDVGKSLSGFIGKSLEKGKIGKVIQKDPSIAAAAGMGSMSKGVAIIADKLAPALELLSKAAAGIGLVSSAALKLVMMFMDLDAAAKDFNKSILQTAGTSEFFSRGMRTSGMGAAKLENTLTSLREGAMNVDNVMWGISKETSASFLSALTAEGVSLGRLQDETEKATGYAKDYAKTTQMSVAYSRAFGVDLNSLTQFQGEMMSEMGMGLDSVQSSFEDMDQSAYEAGIATNKFFGIIRGFSADLTLFTLRMEDITKVMKVLGKTMAPREAQKFLQSLTGKFGGGILENVKTVMLAGEKGAKPLVKKDFETHLKGLSADIVGAIGEGEDAKKIIEIIKKPKYNPREIAKWQARQGSKVNGALMSSIEDAAIMQSRIASGSAADLASVLDMLSPLGKYSMLEQESTNVMGKRIEDLSKNELIAFESLTGLSQQEIRGTMKMNTGMMAAQEDLIKRVSEGQETIADQQQLTRLKVTGSGKATAKILEDMFKADKGGYQFYNSLSKDQKDLLKDSQDQIDYQKETAKFQTSLEDQLKMVTDALMNKIYDVLIDIWEALPNFDKQRKMEIQAARTKNPVIMKAVKEAKGDYSKARMGIIETAGKKVLDSIKAAVEKETGLAKERDKIDLDLTKTRNDKEKAELLEKRKGIQAQLDLLRPITDKKGLTKQQLYDMADAAEVSESGLIRWGKGIETLTGTLSDLENKIKSSGDAIATPGTPAPMAGAKQPPMAAHQKATTKAIEETNKHLEKGIPLVKPKPDFRRATIQDTVRAAEGSKSIISDSTLDAIRKGLFEYYLYSQLDRASVIKSGASGELLAKRAIEKGTPEAGLGDLLEEQAKKAKPKASGGLVTSIVNGQANVARLPAGEGWTPIGKGERILPAGAGGGGGGTRVELEFKGDFRRFINARIVEGSADFHHNRRLR